MTFKKKCAPLLLIFLVLFIAIYTKKNIISNSKFNLANHIGEPDSLNLYDVSQLPTGSNPFNPSLDERQQLSTLVSDNNDSIKFKELYEKNNIHKISEFEMDIKTSKLNTQDSHHVKYMIISGIDFYNSNKSMYYLGQGYIYNNGDFYQLLSKPNSNIDDAIYIKGTFSSKDMDLIDSIYNKAHNQKLEH